MKTFFICIFPTFFLLSCAGKAPPEAFLVSPFPSSVAGTRVSNVHLIDSVKGKVFRGMRLRDKEDVLNLKTHLGMTDVLIFRAASKGVGVEDEIAMLQELGYERSRITQIPFEWKETPSFQLVCEQSLQALELMRAAVLDASKSLYVHCTVGEDRTGYIAALYKMAYLGKNEDEVFRDDMCAHGYADGNKQKPKEVNELIHANITHTFVKMSYLLRTQPESFKALDRKLCEKDPSTLSPNLALELRTAALQRRCLKAASVH
jgi:hypothetical protein